MKYSLALTIAAATCAFAAPTPPGIPSSSDARSELEGLTIADRGSMDGYSRKLFPHWIQQGGGCNTRDVVLKRDGSGVETNDRCTVEGGDWISPYDGKEWESASDLQIDHLVPLENAWVSGASEWTTDQRQAFANDLDNPQLYAVTSSVNENKGDRAPDQWLPPSQSFYCQYAESFIKIKSTYSLIVTQDEHDALSSMLDSC